MSRPNDPPEAEPAPDDDRAPDAPQGAPDEEPDVPLSTALREASRARRRTVLRALGALTVLGAIGGGITELVLWRRRLSDEALAASEAKRADEAVLKGDLRGAKKIASDARDLDPKSHAVAMAFVRASAFDVLDGDGGKDASVALLSDARRLGARGIDLAFASLAAAVGVKNDRLAEKILAEHAERSIGGDMAYAFACGAALDLTCGDEAARRYAEAEELSGGRFVLAKLRRVRALVFASKIDEAKALVAKLPQEARETKVLAALVQRVESLGGASSAKATWVDPSWATELPRSLRALATAMALGDPNAPSGQSAGLDAALDDVDTPLAALLAGRIALAAGDRVSAEAASACALRMHGELEGAKTFAARLALLQGDLPKARELAGEGPDKATVLTIQAIEAYERGDKTRLAEIDAESAGSTERWFGLSAAKALLGDGEAPKPADLDRAIATNEPWAELLAVDAALAAHDVERAKKLALAWAEGPLTDVKKLRKKHIESPEPPKDPAGPDPKTPEKKPEAPPPKK